jgi:hypothetical protein
MTNIDFGHQWRLPSGQRCLLCWHRISGELVLHRPDQRANDILAVIPDEAEVRRRLDGWLDHTFTSNGLAWLAAKLDGCR